MNEIIEDLLDALKESDSTVYNDLSKRYTPEDIAKRLLPDVDYNDEGNIRALIEDLMEGAQGKWNELDAEDVNDDGDIDTTITETDEDGDGDIDTAEVEIEADDSDEASKASDVVREELGEDVTPEEYKVYRAALGSSGDFVPDNDVEDELARTALEQSRMSTGKLNSNIINTLKDVLY